MWVFSSWFHCLFRVALFPKICASNKWTYANQTWFVQNDPIPSMILPYDAHWVWTISHCHLAENTAFCRSQDRDYKRKHCRVEVMATGYGCTWWSLLMGGEWWAKIEIWESAICRVIVPRSTWTMTQPPIIKHPRKKITWLSRGQKTHIWNHGTGVFSFL